MLERRIIRDVICANFNRNAVTFDKEGNAYRYFDCSSDIVHKIIKEQ